MTAKQPPPPEVSRILEWLRGERFAEGGASLWYPSELADLIENGDPCLPNGGRPWEARSAPKRTDAASVALAAGA